ncbi:MAG: hypothetical protein RL221_1365 [Pseudomonadota bacterium]
MLKAVRPKSTLSDHQDHEIPIQDVPSRPRNTDSRCFTRYLG